jgi:hypothetical protein
LGYTGFRVSEVQCALAEGFASIVEGEKRESETPNVYGGRTEYYYLVATSPGGVEGSRMNTSSTLCCATLR